MPRRVDANQKDIVAALRAAGATVQLLHEVGHGCPDLAVGFRGVNYFLECKDEAKAPSAQKLTRHELIWHDTWRGQVGVVRNAEEALCVIGALEATEWR